MALRISQDLLRSRLEYRFQISSPWWRRTSKRPLCHLIKIGPLELRIDDQRVAEIATKEHRSAEIAENHRVPHVAALKFGVAKVARLREVRSAEARA